MAEFLKATFDAQEDERRLRWGMWSPSDRKWYEVVRNLWQVALGTTEGDDASCIPRKIHQVWLGGQPIPDFCQGLMETWKAQHPTWEYRLWTDADAESALTIPNLVDAYARASNPAERSDILRLGLVLQHGGLYVDVDFECLRPLDALHERFAFFCGLSNVGVFELNNGLFAASPGHPLLRSLCGVVGRPWPEWGQQDVAPGEAVAYQLARSGFLETPAGHAPFIATTGPGFFTRGVMRWLTAPPPEAAPMAICPCEVFYPLSNKLRDRPLGERRAHAGPASLALHHWCRTWDKDSREEVEQ